MNHITVYTTSNFPYGRAAENLIREIVLGISANGISVNVTLLRGGYKHSKKNINNTGIDCGYVLFKNHPTNDFLKFLEVLLLLIFVPISLIRNKIKYKSAQMLLYGFNNLQYSLPVILWCKILSIKVYRIVTDRYDTANFNLTKWNKIAFLFYVMQHRYIDKYFSGLICLSYWLKNKYIENKIDQSKICVIPHFINTKLFKNNYNDPFNNEFITIGFCGDITERNGIYILLDAFDLVSKWKNNIKLFLIGGSSENNQMSIKNKIERISGQVQLTGFISGEKVPYYLSLCDILVNPRVSGLFAEAGFPTKLGEYFSTKRPVVATEVGDLSKYFYEKDKLVLVKPNSADSIAQGITFLIDNPLIAKQIGINGFLWGKKHLDYKKNAKVLIDFIGSKSK